LQTLSVWCGEARQATLRLAKKDGIAKHTFWHRDHRRQKAHEDEQTLDAVEEDELVDWLRELDEWGLHLRRSPVVSRVKTIVARSTGSTSTDHIGANWFTGFLKRHPDVRTALSQRKDISCTKAGRDPIRIAAFDANVDNFLVGCFLLQLNT
jgi:hypothetical protein